MLTTTIYTLLAFWIIPLVIEVLFVGETATLFPADINTLSALHAHVEDEKLYSSTRSIAQAYLDSRFGSSSSDGYQGWLNVLEYFQISNFFEQEQVVDNIWGGFLEFLDSKYYYGDHIQLFSCLGKLLVGMGFQSPQLEIAFDFLLASPFRVCSLLAFIFMMIFGIIVVFMAIGRILRHLAYSVYHRLVKPDASSRAESIVPKIPKGRAELANTTNLQIGFHRYATPMILFGFYFCYIILGELEIRRLVKELLAPALSTAISTSTSVVDTPTNTAWEPPSSNGRSAAAATEDIEYLLSDEYEQKLLEEIYACTLATLSEKK